MKVLVLGHNGMLGHIVNQYLKEKGVEVDTTNYRWPSFEFKKRIKEFKGDYIINCIGAIPQKTNKFQINYKIPTWIDINSKAKIIHPASDYEENTKGYYQSKYIASHWIKNYSKNTKIIKSSIIGPEINTKYSLFEWLLLQEKNIQGYSDYYWNGNTTLTWAKECYNILTNWDKYNKETILESECISKYDLLVKINQVFGKEIQIIPTKTELTNKCLKGDVKTPPMKEQLLELKSWIDKNKSLYL